MHHQYFIENEELKKSWLPEQLKSISNLCAISLVLIEADLKPLLPTVLEYMFEICQDMGTGRL